MVYMIEPLIKELLESGVHFGHQTSRWNPKMKRFIFGAKNGIYLVDLEKTAHCLARARDFLRSVAAQGGSVLFIGTKRQAQAIVAEEAARCGQYYVNLRWLGGLLTNFQTIRKSVERLKTIRAWREDGTLSRFTKKEAAQKEKDLGKLEKVLSGIIEMGRLPKAVYVVDAKREETAIKEAKRLGIPVVALLDTNCDPDPITYPIPGNDDALRSIHLVTSLLADAILEGHQSYLAGLAQTVLAEAPVPAEVLASEEPVAADASVEEGGAISAAPLVDEVVEAIVPESVLKVEVDPSLPKKKKATKKIGPKTAKEKEEGPSVG